VGRPSTPRAMFYKKSPGDTEDKFLSSSTVPETDGRHGSSKLNIFQSIKNLIEEKMHEQEQEHKHTPKRKMHRFDDCEDAESVSSVSDEDISEIKSQNIDKLMELYDKKREPGIRPPLRNRIPLEKNNLDLLNVLKPKDPSNNGKINFLILTHHSHTK